MTAPSHRKERPLSPHLQIYRPQITSVLSIFHRMSGVFLFLGSFLWAYWLYAISQGIESYEVAQECMLHPLGLAILVGWTAMLFYHLLNGIRHLMWDAGHGFDLPTMRKTGWIVVTSTVFLTTVTWVQAFLWGEFWS